MRRSAALLESFCEIIAGLGHDWIRALDGAEAVELAREHRPALIVCDYMMPRKTGPEIARALKGEPSLAKTPVLLLSAGRPSLADRHEVWLFLPKPVAIERFEKAIKEGVELTATREGGPSQGLARDVVSPTSLGREEMLSWVSHEIKSPLAAAVTATHLAVRDLRPGGDPRSIERRLVLIARQHARITELINSLLDAAALGDGRLELECEPLDVVLLTDECIESWREMHPDVRIEVVHTDAAAPVRADRERLRQIVDNLLSNAIKYGRPANFVKVETRVDGPYVKVAVGDRGAGIPSAQIDRIFDRFHRVAGQGGRGHGLGLYIARALARLHGGGLEVQSEVAMGSTFTSSPPKTDGSS